MALENKYDLMAAINSLNRLICYTRIGESIERVVWHLIYISDHIELDIVNIINICYKNRCFYEFMRRLNCL
jgi:hypothetical protein